MDRNYIFERLSHYLVTIFSVPEEKICLSASLSDDLDLDSIDAIDLLVKLQELTGKKIKPEEFKSVRSVSDVVDRVYDLVA